VSENDKVKVRTTIRPEDELEVTPQEELDLERQGLLYKGNATTDEGARRAVENSQKPES